MLDLKIQEKMLKKIKSLSKLFFEGLNATAAICRFLIYEIRLEHSSTHLLQIPNSTVLTGFQSRPVLGFTVYYTQRYFHSVFAA